MPTKRVDMVWVSILNGLTIVCFVSSCAVLVAVIMVFAFGFEWIWKCCELII